MVRTPLVPLACLLALLAPRLLLAKKPGAAAAPPLGELLAQARALQRAAGAPAPAPTPLDEYAAQLRGSRVSGWTGWVLRGSPQPGGTYALHLAAEDPYGKEPPAAPGPRARPGGAAAPPPRRTSPADGPATLTLVGLAVAPALSAGQQVEVAGLLKEVELHRGIELTLEQARVKAGPPPPLPEAAATAEIPDLQASLQRGACLGRCPMYKISVSGSARAAGPGGAPGAGGGAVTWRGERFVAATGAQGAQVDAGRLRQIYGAFLRAGFLDLRDRYEDRAVTDCPTVVVSLRQGKEAKTVRHYLCDPSAPQRLTILEEQLDELLDSAAFIEARR